MKETYFILLLLALSFTVGGVGKLIGYSSGTTEPGYQLAVRALHRILASAFGDRIWP